MRRRRLLRQQRSPRQRIIQLCLLLVLTLGAVSLVDVYALRKPVENPVCGHGLYAILPAQSAGTVIHGPRLAGLIPGTEVLLDSLKAQRELIALGHDPREWHVFLLGGDSRRDADGGRCLRPLRVIRPVNLITISPSAD